MVDVGQYGSINDSGVLINSEMVKNFEESSFHLPAAENLEKCPTAELPYYFVGKIFPVKL